METSQIAAIHGNHEDADYDAYLSRVQARFSAATGPLFQTDAEGLYTAYLQAMPADTRQYYTCHACRQFIERFGGLVTIDQAGATTSVIWSEDDAPEHYKPSVAAMLHIVRRAKVDAPFLSTEKAWGTPVTGKWHHFAVKPARVFKPALLTAGQTMAEKREDFKNVMHALNEFTQPMIEQALTLLETDSLYRSEKVIGPAKWLHGLHVARAAAKGVGKANVVWLAIATAPAGFAHPRSSMVGTLLDDIAAGMDFGDVSKRFAAKMHPLQYQRPQAAPSAGNIAQAEKTIEALGLAKSLERRIARLEEVPKLWEPKTAIVKSEAGGVFSHLQAKGAAPLRPMTGIPPVLMTLEKFVRTVVPTADAMELQIGSGHQSFIVVTTAVHGDAPPILQWDREESRNPFSWYIWHGGSTPSQFGLSSSWVKIAAITRLPSRWNDSKAEHQGDGLLLLLEGARETRKAGNGLFPEQLASSLHGIRSTIEAYSKNAQMHGLEDGSAIGFDLRNKSGAYPVVIRVSTSGRAVDYKVDRWD